MDTDTAATNRTLPWYRAPMLWLAVALPALTVVAGVLTYWIAADGLNDADPDAVRRDEKRLPPLVDRGRNHARARRRGRTTAVGREGARRGRVFRVRPS